MKIAHITLLDQCPVDLWACVEPRVTPEGSRWTTHPPLGGFGEWPDDRYRCVYLAASFTEDGNDVWTEHEPHEVPPDIWAQLLAKLLMRELTNATGVNVGDVVIVAQQIADKKTGKPYTWRWYGIVMSAGKITLRLARVGEPEEKHRIVSLGDLRITTSLLTPDETPPAIHAYKMREAMLGRLNI